MNILVVDQNRQMRQAIKSLLADIADNIYECNDEEEAIACSFEYKPDWVLTEVKIEEGNVLESVKQLESTFSQARIMVITNYDDNYSREAARKSGASAYITKDNLIEARCILSAYGKARTVSVEK
jgi:DNA-binding NarL/FixJ family response regulator